MKLLRKLWSILLLAGLLLPVLAPLLALGQDADLRLPACCRRNGAHHCSMQMAAMPGEKDGPAVALVTAKCPCCPGVVQTARHGDGYGLSTAEAIYGGLVSHPAVVAQTASKRRIARERARGKRGPPVSERAWQDVG